MFPREAEENYYEGSAHVLMEAQKPYDLLQARETWWCGSSPNQRAENQAAAGVSCSLV